MFFVGKNPVLYSKSLLKKSLLFCLERPFIYINSLKGFPRGVAKRLKRKKCQGHVRQNLLGRLAFENGFHGWQARPLKLAGFVEFFGLEINGGKFENAKR